MIIPFKAATAKKLEAQPDLYLPPLLSIEDVRDYLGLGKTVVYEMIRSGELPHIRIRNRVRVSADDLRAYIDRHRKEGQAQ
jgi:excisionase family DNA binding protein